MAKQVKVDNSKKAKNEIDSPEYHGRLVARSPVTNLFFAAILGLFYLLAFNQSAGQALIYAIGAFLFFNTVDYIILYYRINKMNKRSK